MTWGAVQLFVVLIVVIAIAFLWAGAGEGKRVMANRICTSNGYDAGADRIRGDWYCVLGEEPDQRLFRLDELIRDAEN